MTELQIKELFENKNDQLENMFDVGWLIGIIEGEGNFSLGLHESNKAIYYQPRIEISNTKIEIISNIERILKKFFINYSIRIRKYENNKNYKDIYILKVEKLSNLKRFLTIFINKFISKKEQAFLLLNYVT